MSDKQTKTKKCGTYIGGQAVIEGVMMMGKTCMATAVRDPSGEIQVEAKRLNKKKGVITLSKIPFLRGIVNLVSSLFLGTKTLMRAASVYADSDEEEEEGGKVSRWLAEKFKLSLMDVVTFFSVILGVLLAVGIFVFLPRLLTDLIMGLIPEESVAPIIWLKYVLLGVFKLVIFIAYLALILLLKDIRRLYMYHGAEHKTINAYEHGMELTPEKVKEASRIHDRCGTSFIFIVLIINIVVLSLVSWAFTTYVIPDVTNDIALFFINIGIELVLLPVIAGISYEILKLLAKFDNKFVDIFKAPGKLLQKLLTTREPDEEMIAVAIAAFKKVLEMDNDETVPETSFITGGVLSVLLEDTKEKFKNAGIDESDAEWIYSLALDVKRSELGAVKNTVKGSEAKKIAKIVEERLTGRPLWYIIGDTEFLDCKIKVDERALIPRPETEILADTVIKSAEDGDKILDMCTGSGCIAVSVAKALKGKCQVTAADVSDAAIMLAKENAKLNGVNVNFVVSDMFSNVHGRYNIIVCNPPYIKSGEIPFIQKEVREYEPRVALDGGDDGLDFYRILAKDIKSYLAKDGMLIVECGEGQVNDILQIFPKRDYVIVIKDLAGVERFIKIAF